MKNKTNLSRVRRLNEMKEAFNYNDMHDQAIILYKYYEKQKAFERDYLIPNYFSENEEKLIAEILKLYEQLSLAGIEDWYKERKKYIIMDKPGLNMYLDSGKIIEDYIDFDEDYELNKYLMIINISKLAFNRCVKRVKENDEELYCKYLEKADENNKKAYDIPKERLDEIVSRIEESKQDNGREFSVFEFYKLAPFIGEDIHLKTREVSILNPEKNLQAKYYKYLRSENDKIRCENGRIYYSGLLYIYAKCIYEDEPEKAEVLYNYIKENNITSTTKFNKKDLVNNLSNDSENNFNKAQREIINFMEENEYPMLGEIFNLLKANKIKAKKLTLAYKGEE